MKTTTLAALAVMFAGHAQAALVVNTEKVVNTGAFTSFTTIQNLSNTDYANASLGNATITVTTNNTPFGGGVAVLNNGIGQANNDHIAQTSFSDILGPNRYLINLGSTQNITAFNSYSYHNEARQYQNFRLYSSNALSAPTSNAATSTAGLVSAGWSLIGAVSTAFPTSPSGQVGVNFTDTLGGNIATARYLLVDVDDAGIGTFFSEFDVHVAAIPEPSSMAMFGLGLFGCVFARRRRVA